MKLQWIVVAFVSALLLSGCATSNYSVGRDFPSQEVQQIVKGKTTQAQILAMFGKPYSKSALENNQEKWVYLYSHGTSHAQSYLITMSVTVKGHRKMLDVLFKDGVVENYSYLEDDGPSNNMTTN
ncbi:outer membrane protein assembly factor BamE domain-containing protein [Celerinatantimonas diazotrophica]|uniref:Outer membrane protein assembly factor BamE (Lipoprotein component of BamABCDE complex) n=1 Tax=Celerinatantimonas diazotrophica TaxID=412034 RepID=A0A4R1KIK4_9GAMM|nr:outer membrane protein assembly factor BamE [Celerinatantimonas diazotrophica]TCK63983.1 outer membrane protein assembly factor BamE (lipoprotein component of BamABCDE complex) [Celerinatantimonas diazotrophica]CAG9297070.1 hypothetical protein CEDIAZO_02232 [Celerinatantimonas diazotrophica]